MKISKLVERLSKNYGNGHDKRSLFDVRDTILMVYDIAGYTQFCDYHESRGEHDSVNRVTYAFTSGGQEIVRSFGGTPHNFTGDGYLSSFDLEKGSELTVHEKALDAALALQELDREFTGRGFFGKYEPMLKVALYRGTSSFRRERRKGLMPFGRAPSTLARIEATCRPGDILASGSVYEPVRDLYDAREVRGIQLRGVSDQKRIYEISGRAA